MNSRELFALFLRMVGVLGIIFIVRHAALGLIPTPTVPSYVLIKWVIGVFAGLYLIRGAPLLTKFAFPKNSGSPA